MAQNTRRPARRQHSDSRHIAEEARQRFLALRDRPVQPHPLYPPDLYLTALRDLIRSSVVVTAGSRRHAGSFK